MKKTFLTKTLSLVLATILILSVIPSIPAVSAATTNLKLSFTPADIVANEDGSFVYLSDQEGMKLWRVDTETFDTDYIEFWQMPGALFYRDGKLCVTLKNQEGSSYELDEEQTGAFAIVDGESFVVQYWNEIPIDPYDIVVSRSKNIYISSELGYLYGFTPDGTELNNYGISGGSTIEYNEKFDKIYAITKHFSPRNMTAYSLATDGKIISSYVWRYHGNFWPDTNFKISTDGNSLFNGFGYQLSCAGNKADDMMKMWDMGQMFHDVIFDSTANELYFAIKEGYIHCYDQGTFARKKTFETTTGSPQRIFLNNDCIVVQTVDKVGNAYLERLEALSEDGTQNYIGVIKPKEPEEIKLPEKTESTLRLPFEPYDMIQNEDGSFVYLSDRADKKIWRVNTETFDYDYISFRQLPGKLDYRDGMICVALSDREWSDYLDDTIEGAFAIVDENTFTIRRINKIPYNPYDIVVSRNKIIYISPGRNSGTKTSADSQGPLCGYTADGIEITRYENLYMHTVIEYNEKFDKIYTITNGLSPRNMYVYSLDGNGKIYSDYQWPYHGDFLSSSIFKISPDGNSLYNGYGFQVSCSRDESNDMVKIWDMSQGFNDIFFEPSADEIYLATTKGDVHCYDEETFIRKKTFRVTTGTLDKIVLYDGSIIASAYTYIQDYEKTYFLERLEPLQENDSQNLKDVVNPREMPWPDLPGWPEETDWLEEKEWSDLPDWVDEPDDPEEIEWPEELEWPEWLEWSEWEWPDWEWPDFPEYEIYGDYECIIFENEVIISEYIGEGGNVAIPEKLGGYPVTEIGGYAFYFCTSLTSVTIPASVNIIGEMAFADCISLSNVVMPGGVKRIGEGAFYNCTSLASVDIPGSVTQVGYLAFANCTSLRSVYFMGLYPEDFGDSDEDIFEDCVNPTVYVPYGDMSWNIFTSYPGVSVIKRHCTVTFSVNGGNAVNAISKVTQGDRINKPADPVQNGRVFGGWYKDAGCTVAWDFSVDTVQENVTVHAKWLTFYTVTFKSNGKTIGNSQTVEKGKSANAPKAPTRRGYKFSGWDKKIDNVTGNLIVNAVWKANNVTLTFVNGKKKTPIKNTFGKKIKLAKSPKASKGKKFKGWYTKKKGGKLVTIKTKVPVKNATYYARWRKIKKK